MIDFQSHLKLLSYPWILFKSALFDTTGLSVWLIPGYLCTEALIPSYKSLNMVHTMMLWWLFKVIKNYFPTYGFFSKLSCSTQQATVYEWYPGICVLKPRSHVITLWTWHIRWCFDDFSKSFKTIFLPMDFFQNCLVRHNRPQVYDWYPGICVLKPWSQVIRVWTWYIRWCIDGFSKSFKTNFIPMDSFQNCLVRHNRPQCMTDTRVFVYWSPDPKLWEFEYVTYDDAMIDFQSHLKLLSYPWILFKSVLFDTTGPSVWLIPGYFCTEALIPSYKSLNMVHTMIHWWIFKVI